MSFDGGNVWSTKQHLERIGFTHFSREPYRSLRAPYGASTIVARFIGGPFAELQIEDPRNGL